MTKGFSVPQWALIFLLALAANQALSAACNPALQSCAPSADFGGNSGDSSGGGQTCQPSPGGSTCGGAGVASQGNSSGTEQGAGNPINIINGNKFQVEVDMPALPGVLGLELVRYYNSQYSLPNEPVGILGHGWKLSYETRLRNTAVGVQIVQADGTRLIFQKNSVDRSRCVTQNPANGVVHIQETPRGKEYLWRWPGNGSAGGRELMFNEEGRLVQIKAPTGEFVSLRYSPQGVLQQVRDPQGRMLQLNYLDHTSSQLGSDGLQKFRGLQSVDSPVGRFIFQYGSPMPKDSKLSQELTAANLTQVAIPTRYDANQRAHAFSNVGVSRSDIARIYHYENPKFPTLMTGISVQGTGSDGVVMHQRISTYGYDSWGKAVMSEKADGVEKVRLDTSRPGQTVLTNALGQTTHYKFADIAGHWRLLESRGAGCAQCGPPNMRYGYDKLGRLTEQTQLNAQGQAVQQLRTTLDVQGRAIKIEKTTYAAGKPMQTQWSVRYEYPSADATAPGLTAWPSVMPGREHSMRVQYNAAGQPTSVTETGYEPVQGLRMQRTTQFTYQLINRNSVLVAVDGPLPNGPRNRSEDSDITQLTWDKLGRAVQTMTLPGGAHATLSYAPGTGLLSGVKNNQGNHTELVYDTHTRLVTIRKSGPGWAQPRVQSYRYDALGRATQIGLGETTDTLNTFKPYARQSFDAAGRLVWHVNVLGELIQNRYDSESRLLQTGKYNQSMALEQRAVFDASGQWSGVADNAGRQWKALPAFSDSLQPSVQTAAQALHKAEQAHLPISQKDDFGREVLTSSADHGRVHRMYDAADRLIEMTDANGHHAQYGYTAEGRIDWQSVALRRDDHSQMTAWQYNPFGQVTALEHPMQSERYDYDERGLQTARTVILKPMRGSKSSTLEAQTRYVYDAQGQLVASTLPDGTLLQYVRNGQGQVTQVMRNPIRTHWLRWLAQPQTIVKDITRDLVGLSSYTNGNGTHAVIQRSPQGDLARIAYLRGAKAKVASTSLQAKQQGVSHILLGRTTQETIAMLLGVSNAHAFNTVAEPQHSAGALGLPKNPLAFMDRRYLWDARGNLMHTQNFESAVVGKDGEEIKPHETKSYYAYDRQAQLIAASAVAVETGQSLHTRFAYDRWGRRVLSQEHVSDPGDFQTKTYSQNYQPGTHRRAGVGTTYTPNGQPFEFENRQFEWDALGRLTHIRPIPHLKEEQAELETQTQAPTIRYTYDHRGLRISKMLTRHAARAAHSQSELTRYLYDTAHQPLAELDAQGLIKRQYIYVGNLPLAVIDTPDGQTMLGEFYLLSDQAWMILQDLGHALLSWFSDEAGMGELAWLHTNHLGAPEAATDAQGELLWQAHYAPFGAATVQTRQEGQHQNFVLNLRLPGQYFDAETGLHYNRQRYYDAQAGQYLSPDPMGHPNGRNPYAYVRHNPLAYVDPEGLVLFAFDGTSNSNDSETLSELGNSVSNVWQFRQLYNDGNSRYVSGVGTRHRETDPQFGDDIQLTWGNTSTLDMATNFTGPQRIERMVAYFNAEAELAADNTALMDVDIIGFSRGGAQARDFANRINANTRNGQYSYTVMVNGVAQQRCQMINFRFLGLWDTVLSTNLSGSRYQLDVVPGFQHVAQAVALNEYRGDTFRRLPDSTGAFPLESIMGSILPVGQTRIEMGFIGAHSDIGGGLGSNNELSRVALSWMIEQARGAGVKLLDSTIAVPSSAVIHDKSDNQYCIKGPGCSEDREVRGADASTQRAMKNTGLTFDDTGQFVTYYPPQTNQDGSQTRTPKSDASTGTVDMKKYVAWLKSNGYNLGNLKVE